MREIKFRAWDKAIKNWEDFALWSFETDNDDSKVLELCGKSLVSNEQGIILQQYSGLKDENGKEICEGDIVSYKNPKYRGVVRFGQFSWFDYGESEYGTGFYIDMINTHVEALYATQNLKVIGNIYENPELVENLEN